MSLLVWNRIEERTAYAPPGFRNEIDPKTIFLIDEAMSRTSSLISAIFFIITAAIAGGGSKSGNFDDPEKLHIRKVVGLVTEYTIATKKPPTSLDEVKNWAVKEGKASEEDFSSTRDKQPYGLSAGGMGGAQVYEQQGKNGRCYIFLMGGVADMSQEQVANMTKRMGTAAPKGGPPGMKK